MPVVCFEVLCQSMPIDERFLCGYRFIIDWLIPIDTNKLILSIDRLLFQSLISIDWIPRVRVQVCSNPGEGTCFVFS